MGLEAAGFTTVFQCEIDKHARSVLDYHWPNTPKWGDVSTLTGEYILKHTDGVDVVAWGSPCQDLSLAGKRAGLSGERSGLFHEGIRIIKELRELSNGKYPTWSIWENVLGALSSNGGADFGQVLYEMDEAGACFSEWVVLDAQYFGVPQRRRRVFVSSCFDSATSSRCPEPLFPVSESLRGDSSKGKQEGKDSAEQVTAGFGNSGFTNWSEREQAVTLSARDYKSPNTVVVEPNTFSKSRRAQSVNDHETWVESDVVPTLNVFDVGDTRATTAIVEPVLLDGRRVDDVRVYSEPVQTLQERMGTGGNNVPVVAQEGYTASSFAKYTEGVGTLKAAGGDLGGGSETIVVSDTEPLLVVRRLTPLECERLMGWPDNHTSTGVTGVISDTNRYKMCGNGVASPVAAWIGKHLLTPTLNVPAPMLNG